MDAISSSNGFRVQTSKNHIRRGTNTELLKIEQVSLWFLGGIENNRLVGVIKEGAFSIHMIIQSQSPAMMSKCVVEDIEWPLTRDYPILRVGKRSFTFSMPGLVYGLQLPQTCHDHILNLVKRIFMRFGCYRGCTEEEIGKKVFGSEDGPFFWPISQWTINYISDPILKKLGTYCKKDEIQVYNMNERVLRVQHMSLIVKLITKGLIIGKIDPAEHVVVTGKSWPSENDDNKAGSRASPTIFLFSDLVEALEETKAVMNLEHQTISISPYEPKWSPLPNVTFWNISKSGLIMMLGVIKDAVHINFEVTVRAILGQTYHNFFLPIKLETEQGGMGEDNEPRRDIKFPILNENGGLNNEQKTVVEQLGLTCAQLD